MSHERLPHTHHMLDARVRARAPLTMCNNHRTPRKIHFDLFVYDLEHCRLLKLNFSFYFFSSPSFASVCRWCIQLRAGVHSANERVCNRNRKIRLVQCSRSCIMYQIQLIVGKHQHFFSDSSVIRVFCFMRSTFVQWSNSTGVYCVCHLNIKCFV